MICDRCGKATNILLDACDFSPDAAVVYLNNSLPAAG